MSIEEAVRAACLWEVTARKVGNVHPLASFADCDWEAFAASADAIAPVLGGAAGRPLGESIFLAVEATRERVGRNTNLGMILLLAPLAAVPDDGAPTQEGVERVRAAVRGVLDATTVEDCRLLYDAIRLARPGGLGKAEREDVSAPPTVTLVEAMRLAADRDAVARQNANGFEQAFVSSYAFLAADPVTLERQIVATHLGLIADGFETLIARKCGPETAAEAARRAAEVRQAIADRGPGGDALTLFDAWLRADGNRRNPGTTADLIAAALFLAIRRGVVHRLGTTEALAYAHEIRRSGRPLPDFASR